ncbi:hypothetical protein E4T44_02202, partial [Aureobasidium sp. EXF-8845]
MRHEVFLGPSSNKSSVTLSPTPSTPNVRPSLHWILSTPSSVRTVSSMVSAA